MWVCVFVWGYPCWGWLEGTPEGQPQFSCGVTSVKHDPGGEFVGQALALAPFKGF